MVGPAGDGDARVRRRVRRVVAIGVMVGLSVVTGCSLRASPVPDRPPEPTGAHIDPIERTVPGVDPDRPSPRRVVSV